MWENRTIHLESSADDCASLSIGHGQVGEDWRLKQRHWAVLKKEQLKYKLYTSSFPSGNVTHLWASLFQRHHASFE